MVETFKEIAGKLTQRKPVTCKDLGNPEWCRKEHLKPVAVKITQGEYERLVWLRHENKEIVAKIFTEVEWERFSQLGWPLSKVDHQIISIVELEYLYSTIKRGTVKVTSAKQHQMLHARRLPHTHVYRSKSGKIYRERWP